MKPIEKLARRICWLEWPTRPKEHTEASYWRVVHPDQKAEYIRFLRRKAGGLKMEFYPRLILSHPAIPQALRVPA